MSRPELHVLTDPHLARGRDHREIVRAALAGGADVIQLRDKSLSEAELFVVARDLRGIVRAAGRQLVINDRLDLALAIDADGLHLGPEDLPLAQARSQWRGRLGGSARTPERARELEAAGADYLGVGPLWGSSTKPAAGPALGPERLAEIVAATNLPVIAIGGIAPGNAAAALRAGARGVAVIASVVGAEDPEAATAALRAELDQVALRR
ncbi:MAG: thiamine phosphate synthase [bacterium]